MTKSVKNKNGSEEFTISLEFATEKPNLSGDWMNFFLLMLLYIIQGFPKGFAIGFSIILQSKKLVNYEDQAALSIALWPQWMKILWAPIVDASYIQWIGRRKCWLLLLQSFMGSMMIFMAKNIDDWLPETGKPNLKMLTTIIFIINILSATQDIVVDGWALTMLKKKNVSYCSTCNIIGIITGMFVSSICFVLLVSEDFSNKYFQITPGAGGLITIKTFIYTWGIFILIITLLIGVFKKEKNVKLEENYVKLNVVQNYKLLWKILKLSRVRILAVALITMRIGYISMENTVSNLKLIDAGISKDDMMMVGVLNYAISLSTPFFTSKYITSSKPMSYYLKIMPFKLLWAITYAALIYLTPNLIRKNEVIDVPIYYYVILGSIIFINEIMSVLMMLLVFSLFCRISDPRFGGTYMTLFNTLYFLGYLVSNTVVLKLIAIFTFSECSNEMNNNCSTADLKNLCKTIEGNCEVYIDGYYTIIVLNMVIGFIWYIVFRKTLIEYESLNQSQWLINVKQYKTTKLNDNRSISL